MKTITFQEVVALHDKCGRTTPARLESVTAPIGIGSLTRDHILDDIEYRRENNFALGIHENPDGWIFTAAMNMYVIVMRDRRVFVERVCRDEYRIYELV